MGHSHWGFFNLQADFCFVCPSFCLSVCLSVSLSLIFLVTVHSQPWFHSDWIYFLTPKGRKFQKYCLEVHNVAEEIIKNRKEALVSLSSAPKNAEILCVCIAMYVLIRWGGGEGGAWVMTDLLIRFRTTRHILWSSLSSVVSQCSNIAAASLQCLEISLCGFASSLLATLFPFFLNNSKISESACLFSLFIDWNRFRMKERRKLELSLKYQQQVPEITCIETWKFKL